MIHTKNILDTDKSIIAISDDADHLEVFDDHLRDSYRLTNSESGDTILVSTQMILDYLKETVDKNPHHLLRIKQWALFEEWEINEIHYNFQMWLFGYNEAPSFSFSSITKLVLARELVLNQIS